MVILDVCMPFFSNMQYFGIKEQQMQAVVGNGFAQIWNLSI